MNESDWKKSRYCQASSDCVEVHRSLALVRDSKNHTGPTLRCDLVELINAIKDGSLRD